MNDEGLADWVGSTAFMELVAPELFDAEDFIAGGDAMGLIALVQRGRPIGALDAQRLARRHSRPPRFQGARSMLVAALAAIFVIWTISSQFPDWFKRAGAMVPPSLSLPQNPALSPK